MKNPIRWGVVLLLLAGLPLAYAFAQGVKGTAAVEIKPGLYAINWPEGGGNIAFLVTDEGVIVVDSGESAAMGQEIVARIREKTDKPIKYVILTHYHDDHTGGLQSFPPSAVIIGHQNLGENRTTGVNADLKAYPAHIEKRRKEVEKLKTEGSADLKRAQERLDASVKAFESLKENKLILPSLEFGTTLRIHSGKDTVAIHQQGNSHTSCSSFVYFERQKVLHMGDMVFAGAHPYIDSQAGANTKNWIEVTKSLEGWDVDSVIPGHGPNGGKSLLAIQARYLEDLHREVGAAMSKSLPLTEVTKAVTMAAYNNYRWTELLPLSIEAVFKELTADVKK